MPDIATRQRPAAVGVKFHEDGSIRAFPGNTVVCHVPPVGGLMRALVAAHDRLRDVELDGSIALLPPSSYHMTVFEGICADIRTAANWPENLPLDAPLEAVTEHFARALDGFDLELILPFRLRATRQQLKWGSTVLALEPLNMAEEVKLRRLRDRLAHLLKLRAPGHDSYVFHITLAYVTDWPSQEDEQKLGEIYADLESRVNALGPVEMGAPEFCVFDDMSAFRRLFFVGG